MIEGKHRVGFAAAEIGLELHHRVPCLSGETVHRTDQHSLEALGQIGTPEELHGIPVFVASLTHVYLPEIGCKLRLLIEAAGHVPVRGNDLPPWFKMSCCPAFNGCSSTLSLLPSDLFVESQAEEFHFHLFNFIGLWS